MPWLVRRSVPPDSDAWLFPSVSRPLTLTHYMPDVTAIFVGNAREWIPELIERAKGLKIAGGFEENADLSVYPAFHVRTCADGRSGPVISPDAKARIEKLIQSVDDEGGKILLDGRGVKVQGYPNGNWVGPTVVECTTDMSAYK